MTEDRYDQLKPPHLVTTLRSFPRRYRAALAAVPAPQSLVAPIDGHCVLALLTDTVRTLEVLDRALDETLVRETPTIPDAAVDATARRWPTADPATAPSLLDELARVAASLATRIDRTPSGDWSRTATCASRADAIRAIDIAREAARAGAENLRVIERILPELAG